MERLTKYSNDLIRNKAVNILRKLESKNGLNGDELALISSFCLIERVENNQLKKYEDLEEQGKLLKLPCAVGDTAWIVFEGEIFKCMVSKFDIVRNGIFPMLRINETLETISVSMKTLEKTWFLTKEAAEAALKELSIK